MLTNLCPGGWNNNSERTDMKVDEENGKAMGMVNGRHQKVWRFSEINFGITLVALFQLLPLVFGDIGCGIRKSK